MVGDGMKALHKDFWMEIRKSKARFISIFLIVALGVAFFSGIQASSPDMRYSGDAYYEAAKLMDLKIQGTLGLTQRDVKAVSDIDGVELAEGSYSTDVMSGEDDARKVLHLESISSNFNLLTADEGRIPEKSGEIFLDKPFAKNRGYKIGDTISVSEDGDSELLKKQPIQLWESEAALFIFHLTEEIRLLDPVRSAASDTFFLRILNRKLLPRSILWSMNPGM